MEAEARQETLWEQNRGLCYRIARRYMWYIENDPAIDIDDLAQQAFFGLVTAAESFDGTRGKTWAGWAAWHVAKELRDALGLANARNPYRHRVARLNAPIDGEDDDLTLEETIADENAPSPDECALQRDIRYILALAVSELEPLRRECVQMRFCKRMTERAIGEKLGLSVSQVRSAWGKGLRDLRMKRPIMALSLDESTNFCPRVGVEEFHRTRTSATEKAVLWRIDHERKGNHEQHESKSAPGTH